MSEEKEERRLSLALQAGNNTITDVRTEENITYFKIGDIEFATFGHSIYTADHPIITAGAGKVFARKAEDPVGKAETIIENEEFNEEWEMFMKYKNEFYEIVIRRAMKVLVLRGRGAASEELCKYLDGLPEQPGGYMLLKEIKKKYDV